MTARDAVIIQNPIPVTERLVLYGDVNTLLNGFKTAFDSQNGRFYLMDSIRVYTFDVKSSSWDLHHVLDSSFYKSNMDYSQFHNGLLFWDWGVGRVFLLDSTKTVTRLDKSFNHRNQFGHAAWVDPNSGIITAFGGYGLFKSKSLLTRFSPRRQEWNETQRPNFYHWPSPQFSSFAFPDFDNGVVYLLGLKMTHADHYSRGFPEDEKTKKAFWKYHIASNSWTRLADAPEELNIKSPVYKGMNLTNYSVHPERSFLLFSVDDGYAALQNRGLYIFETAQNLIKRITSIEPSFDDRSMYMSINWSSVDQLFYAMTFEYNYDLRRVIFNPVTIEITDETAFLEQLRAREEPLYPVVTIIFAILFVSMPIGTWLVNRHRSTHNKQHPMLQQVDKIISIQLQPQTGMSVIYKGEIGEQPGEAELKLLELLARRGNSKSYVVSDDIELLLLPSHPSQDYARRFRNLTMDRLISYLGALTGDPKREYVLKRPTMLDKRKFEYRLNETYFQIEFQEDRLSTS